MSRFVYHGQFSRQIPDWLGDSFQTPYTLFGRFWKIVLQEEFEFENAFTYCVIITHYSPRRMLLKSSISFYLFILIQQVAAQPDEYRRWKELDLERYLCLPTTYRYAIQFYLHTTHLWFSIKRLTCNCTL